MIDSRNYTVLKLSPLSKKLINNTVKRYQNNNLANIFNYEELNGIANELISIISDKIISNDLEEAGIYNYFVESFTHKCQDLYQAHAKTQKRGGINLSKEDSSKCITLQKFVSDCPASLLEEKEEMQSIISFLKKHDTLKIPYSTIIQLLINGLSIKEIEDTLGIPRTSLERYRRDAILMIQEQDFQGSVNSEQGQDILEFNATQGPSLIMKTTELKKHISREIKFNNKQPFSAKFKYFCHLELYQDKSLLKKDKILLDEFQSNSKEEYFNLEQVTISDVADKFLILIEQKSDELKKAS